MSFSGLLLGALLAGLALGAEAQEKEPAAGRKKAPAKGKQVKPAKPEEEKFHPFSTSKEGIQIARFIRWASLALNKPFVWSPHAYTQAIALDPNKKIVLTEEMRIPHSQLLDFVRTNLRVHDLALIPVGPPGAEFYLVESTRQPTIMRTRKLFVPEEELEKYKDSYVLIVTSIHVKHVDMQQIQTQIQRLNPQATPYGASIIPVPSENALIVADFGPEVWNVYQLVKAMDKEGTKFDQTLEILSLKHASAAEVEAMLSEILQEETTGPTPTPGQPALPGVFGGPRKAPPPKIIPDERTNSLVVYATAEDHRKIRELVARLDTEVEVTTGDIFIYPLQNTVAEEMVKTLREILEGRQAAPRTRPGRGPGQQTIQTRGGAERVQIVADKGSNAVLVRGSKSRVREVVELIRQLDVRKPQVLVEAAIVELRHDSLVELGVELGAFDAKKNLADTFRPFGFTSLGLSSLTVNEQGVFRVPNIGSQGVIGGIFNGDGFLFPVLLRAFQNKGYANFLSMPSILTNDNAEATIRVSRAVPYSQLNQGAVGQVSTQTFGGFEEAPIELTISPHIASENYLRLDIRFKVEVFTATSLRPDIPPPKTSREITTAITVPNGATVVIGGLTLDDQQDTRDQVPLLGDIPLLGALFRSSSTRHTKNTLYLFLTPRILAAEDFSDLDEISTRKKAEIAALKGQIQLVDPEFGRRFNLLEEDRTVEDLEATGAFDLPVLVSPVDKRPGKAEKEKGEDAKEKEKAGK